MPSGGVVAIGAARPGAVAGHRESAGCSWSQEGGCSKCVATGLGTKPCSASKGGRPRKFAGSAKPTAVTFLGPTPHVSTEELSSSPKPGPRVTHVTRTKLGEAPMRPRLALELEMQFSPLIGRETPNHSSYCRHRECPSFSIALYSYDLCAFFGTTVTKPGRCVGNTGGSASVRVRYHIDRLVLTVAFL